MKADQNDAGKRSIPSHQDSKPIFANLVSKNPQDKIYSTSAIVSAELEQKIEEGEEFYKKLIKNNIETISFYIHLPVQKRVHILICLKVWIDKVKKEQRVQEEAEVYIQVLYNFVITQKQYVLQKMKKEFNDVEFLKFDFSGQIEHQSENDDFSQQLEKKHSSQEEAQRPNILQKNNNHKEEKKILPSQNSNQDNPKCKKIIEKSSWKLMQASIWQIPSLIVSRFQKFKNPFNKEKDTKRRFLNDHEEQESDLIQQQGQQKPSIKQCKKNKCQ